MTENQFINYVHTAIEQHVSRDEAITPEDRHSESQWAAKSIATMLTAHGFDIPHIHRPPQRVNDDD